MPFFFYFFYFFIVFYFIGFVLNNHGEQRLRAALAMVKKKPHHLSFIHPGTRDKRHQPKSLLFESNRTTAMQIKKSNSN